MKHRHINSTFEDISNITDFNKKSTPYFVYKNENDSRVFSKKFNANLLYCNSSAQKTYAYVQNSGAYLPYLDEFSVGGCTFLC